MRVLKKQSIDKTALEPIVNDETIKLVKKHLKESKNLVKSVIISNNSHESLKKFCKMKGLKISPFLESLIEEHIINYNKKKSQPE